MAINKAFLQRRKEQYCKSHYGLMPTCKRCKYFKECKAEGLINSEGKEAV